MRIDIQIGDAAIKLTNEQGEVVYSAAVDSYSASIEPEKLVECISAAAEHIGKTFAEVSARLEAL